MGRLDGKRALVTGGASGIGAATVRRFIEEGATVYVVERNEGKRTVAESMGARFGRADVRDSGQVETVVAQAEDALGGLDIVVAGAGVELIGDALETSYEQWDDLNAVLVRGVHATFRSALPGMLERRAGSLIAIASQLAYVAIPRWVAYTAAKTALLGLVRGYALDFGDRGIRCNALCPGPTFTAMTERQIPEGADVEATLREWSSGITLGRFGRPEEIAAGAVFLASDEASFMTGASLVIDGGITGR